MKTIEYSIHDNPKEAINWIRNLNNDIFGYVGYNIQDRDYKLFCVYSFESAATMLLFKLTFG